MDIVLGVSMTPSAVRMVLVEGENADGRSLDHDAFDIPAAGLAATSAAPQQVVDAILGTRESALEGGHRLTSIGVAWTDHAAAGTLRGLLRSHRLDDVVLVSELHAASALAQAIGQTVGYERTALLFVERETATLAVVRAADGAVVRVMSRPLPVADAVSELQAMVTNLDNGPEPAQAVYVVGSGVDVAALEPEIASATSLPVHAPQDADLALARGAALASASTPRYEASTVWLASTEDTAAGATQMAAAGYMAPLGYSAVSDDDDLPIESLFDGLPDGVSDGADPQPTPDAEPTRKSFVLVGGALSGLFVVGVAALAVTLAVVIRPTADQRPTPGGSPVVSSAPAAVPAQAKDVTPPAAPETIQAPIPVVQEAPRTVVVAPAAPPAPAPAAAPEPAPAPAAPPPAPEPAPPPPPPPPAPSPAPPPPAPAPSPAAPAPPPPAPVIVPVPIVIPPIFQPTLPTVPRIPTPRIPSSTATYPSYPTYTTPASPPPARTPYPTSTPPVTTYPQYPAAPTTTVAPSAGSSSSGASGSGSGGSSSGGSSGGDSGGSDSGSSKRSQNPLWPLWPFG